MPRIYDKYNNPLDFCKECFPDEVEFLSFAECLNDDDEQLCETCDLNISGEDGCHYGYHEEHPPYSDTEYKCEECGEELTDNDD